jgi:hypothetical protein
VEIGPDEELASGAPALRGCPLRSRGALLLFLAVGRFFA